MTKGSLERLKMAEVLSAPGSFDISHCMDGALWDRQIEGLAECMFGDLTELESSEEEEPDEVEEESLNASCRQSIDGSELKGDRILGKVVLDHEKGAGEQRVSLIDESKMVQGGVIKKRKRAGKRIRDRRGRKKGEHAAMVNNARGSKRYWKQVDMGAREGPNQKKLKAADRLASDVEAGNLPRASTGWQGTLGLPEEARDFVDSGESPSLNELGRRGMQLIAWDGKEPKAIHDANGRAVVILAGQPDRDEFRECCEAAHDLLLAGGRLFFSDPKHHKEHPRGCFPNPGGGMGMGGGSSCPNPVDFKSKKVERWWYETFESKPFQKIVRFTRNCMLAACGDHLRESDAVLDEVCRRDLKGRLHRLKGSAFAAATFNVGERSWTKPHRDLMNLACWFCSVTALGQYDYTKEGHLILWELKMVIQFPPGSTIFLPSALLTHSNVPVVEGCRTSFVQYSAAGLYRYARCGYRTLSSMDSEEAERFRKDQRAEMADGLEFFEKVGLALGR